MMLHTPLPHPESCDTFKGSKQSVAMFCDILAIRPDELTALWILQAMLTLCCMTPLSEALRKQTNSRVRLQDRRAPLDMGCVGP